MGIPFLCQLLVTLKMVKSISYCKGHYLISVRTFKQSFSDYFYVNMLKLTEVFKLFNHSYSCFPTGTKLQEHEIILLSKCAVIQIKNYHDIQQ